MDRGIYPVRKSIRLKTYDYSQTGAYFLTVCTNGKSCLFGTVAEDGVLLNDAGEMVNQWLGKIPTKFLGVELDEFTIMPNHVHAIIVLSNEPTSPQRGPVETANEDESCPGTERVSLGTVVQWFKTMTTNEYIANVKGSGWQPFDKKLWQRNYYEHIIRGESDLAEIREYVKYNYAKWGLDKENPLNQKP